MWSLEVLPGCCKISAPGEGEQEEGGTKATLTPEPFHERLENKLPITILKENFVIICTQRVSLFSVMFFILYIRWCFKITGWKGTHRNSFFFTLGFQIGISSSSYFQLLWGI